MEFFRCCNADLRRFSELRFAALCTSGDIGGVLRYGDCGGVWWFIAALGAFSDTVDETIVSGPLGVWKLCKNEFSLYVVVVEFKIISAFFAAFPDFASSSAFRRISSSSRFLMLSILF